MAEPVRILLLEDEPNDAELVQRALKGLAGAFVIRSVADEPSFLTELEEFRPDIVLADYTLPGFSGTEALEIVRAHDPHVPFIFVTGSMGEEVAVDALRAGATDYVLKDRLERLPSATERALAESAERRRAEEAEQRYRLLVEQIAAITYITEVDEDGGPRTTFMSPQVEEITGYPPQAWVDDPSLRQRILHPADAARVRMQERRCEREGVPFEGEYRVIAKNGRAIWIHDRMTAIKDASGVVRLAQGVIFDISDRKRAEEGIHRREEILRAVAFAAERFLRAPSWESVAREALGRFGRAASADRVVVTSMRPDGAGEYLTNVRASWAAPGLPPIDEATNTSEFPMIAPGFGRWVERLQAGEAIAGDVASFPQAERLVFEATGTRSLVAMPLFAGDDWYGAMILSSVRLRPWSQAELDALSAAAGALGAAIAREGSQAALAESEERFRVLADNARDFVFRFRVLPTPGFEYVSPSVERISGFTPAELYERPDIWEEMIPAEERGQMESAMADAVEGSGRFTARWRAKDGRAFWSETQLTPITDRDGAMIAVDGIARDVTDRVEAERALETRARQQAAVAELGARVLSDEPVDDLFKSAAALVAEALDVEHVRIREARPEGELVLRAAAGWPAEAIGGSVPYGDPTLQAGFRLAHPEPLIVDDLEREDRFVPDPTLLEEGVRSMITVVIPGDDAPFGILGAFAREPSRFRESDVDFLRAVANVLAESIRLRGASAALARKEGEFRGLAENSPDVISRFDRDLRILYINPAVEAATGRPPEAFIGHTNRENRMPEPALGRWDSATIKAFETGESSTIEFEWETPRGPRYYEAQVIPELDEHGEVVSVLGVARDLTERRETQRHLEENLALLHRTDQERSKLLSQIANAQEEERKRIAADIHDDSIQVMTAAGMRLGVLRRRLTDDKQIEALDAVEITVERSIRRLRRLMFELRPPALERDGLSAAIHAYLESPRSEDERGPEYHITDRFEHEPPPDERALLYRIVQEAVANARKHAHASHVRVDLEERDGGFAALIADDGVGFDPDVVDPGTPGHIGLASMRERADLLGGECTIRSTLGEGTTVDVWVPSAVPGVDGSAA